MRRWLPALIVLAALVQPGAAADDRPLYLRVDAPDRATVERLARVVDVDRVEGGSAWVYAERSDLERLRAMGFAWERLPDPGINPEARTTDSTRALTAWDVYPTYAAYVQMMQDLADDYPDLCKLVVIGATTNQVRPHQLLALKISDNPGVEEDEPEVFLTSSMHGDETTGYVTLLRLANELLTVYDPASSDPGVQEITRLVDGVEIWINPSANPDGTYYSSDTSVSGAIRSYTTASGGSAGMDPNRNFPDPEDGDHPDGRQWWAETIAMMDFAGAHSFNLSVNFHGGAEVVNYPWDTWARLHADDAWYQAISHAYADQVQADGEPGYMDGFDDGITNGYDWYEVAGGRQDYMNWWHGCREVTIEVSDVKLVSASTLPTYWTANRQALLDFVAQALTGVRGLVTAPGGTPLDATVTVLGHDFDHSEVFTDPDAGDYHRMLLPGTYDLRFSAYGYVSQDVSGVVVTSGDATRLDVVLQPAASVEVTGLVTTPDARAALPGATVELVDTPLPPAVTGADGRYAIAGVLEDLYTFRVSAPGYATVEEERTVAVGSTVHDFALAPLTVAFGTDLEADDGGLTGTGGWEWGEPSGADNPGAHSPTRVWATNLDGTYSNDAQWNLDLAGIVIPSHATLEFWHAYTIESGWDGGALQISTNGGSSFALLVPEGGYPDQTIDALGDTPGFTGSTGGWQKVTVDLAAYAGQTATLRWRFGTDGSQVRIGWYLDDITVAAAYPRADFDAAPLVAGIGETVEFTDRSAGGATAWSWSFGDGATSTEQHPSHAYGAPGSYTVTLTATFPTGDDVRVRADYVVVAEVIFADGFDLGDMDAWSVSAP